MRLILQGRFLFVHIPFGIMVKFRFLVQFSVDHLPQPVMSSPLIIINCWSLSDSKSPQVSRTHLRILTVLNNAVIWIVSTHPPTSKSSRPFNNPLVIVPKAPIKIGGTIVTFMFHSFFNSLAKSRYLSFFSLSFGFILWSAGTAKSTILHYYYYYYNYYYYYYYYCLEIHHYYYN